MIIEAGRVSRDTKGSAIGLHELNGSCDQTVNGSQCIS